MKAFLILLIGGAIWSGIEKFSQHKANVAHERQNIIDSMRRKHGEHILTELKKIEDEVDNDMMIERKRLFVEKYGTDGVKLIVLVLGMDCDLPELL